MAEWYTQTPTLVGLSKLVNLYYFFKVGYDAGIANDLAEYILSDDELEAIQGLLLKEKLVKESN